MFCIHCGYNLADSKICPYCGHQPSGLVYPDGSKVPAEQMNLWIHRDSGFFCVLHYPCVGGYLAGHPLSEREYVISYEGRIHENPMICFDGDIYIKVELFQDCILLNDEIVLNYEPEQPARYHFFTMADADELWEFIVSADPIDPIEFHTREDEYAQQSFAELMAELEAELRQAELTPPMQDTALSELAPPMQDTALPELMQRIQEDFQQLHKDLAGEM